MSDQVTADRPDAHQGDEIAERQRCPERRNGDDVAEERQRIAGLFESATCAGVGVGQGIGGRRSGIDERRRPHRHRAVREDDRHVERQPDTQHPHAGEVAVHERESGERSQRRSQQRSLDGQVDHPGGDLECDPDEHHGGVDHDRRPQVTSMGSAQRTDGGTDGTGDQGREHPRGR